MINKLGSEEGFKKGIPRVIPRAQEWRNETAVALVKY